MTQVVDVIKKDREGLDFTRRRTMTTIRIRTRVITMVTRVNFGDLMFLGAVFLALTVFSS